jgi:uncharacterized RDD family membrane protein YckC
MGSALLDTDPLDPAFAEASSDSPAVGTHAAARTTVSPASTEALRRQVAERLVAHRSRRPHTQPALAQSPASSPSTPERASRIAAVVAQRYAHSLSYRAYLAAEAERATQQAQAAAQIAALNAQAVARAQQQLLNSLHDEALNDEAHDLAPCELTLWPDVQPASAPRTATNPGASSSATASSSPKAGSTHSHPRNTRANSQSFAPELPGLTVHLFDDGVELPVLGGAHLHLAISAESYGNQQDDHDDEARLLDEEIAFRQSPIFEEPAGPPMPLPANLIEFPRQLVAPRKARPRYAEGPLRAADGHAPDGTQLRIFEVDPAQISTTPVPAEAPAPQWTSIWLDAPDPGPSEPIASQYTEDQPAASPSVRTAPLPQIASIARRLTAAAIDTSILLAGFLAFTATFLFAAGRSIPLQSATSLSTAFRPFDRQLGMAGIAAQTGLQPSLALVASALVLALLYLLYQALFFSFSDATPGMRCSRIALCTFDDENPTRRAMRRRILAVLLSVCPLGLGLLWATFDEDRLAWHDRLTRIYQRSY